MKREVYILTRMGEKMLAVFAWLLARLERNNKFMFAGE